MPKLQDIPDIPSDAVELLEAVGYLDVEDLTSADVSELHTELVKANDKLSILEEAPSAEQVLGWQEALSGDKPVTDEYPEAEDEKEPEPESEPEPEPEDDLEVEIINFENDFDVMEMLAVSPAAQLLPGSLIKRNEIAVKDIPEGILLTQCESDLDINVRATSITTAGQRKAIDAKRTGLATSRIRSFDQMDSEDHTVKPLDRGKQRDAVSLSEGLNKGLSPESKRFIRGVLHPDAVRVKVAAFFASFVFLALITAFIGIPWLLYHENQSGQNMIWWVVGVASTLLLSGLCYLFWSIGARCRICGQRLYAPKKCLKNKKAHHIPLLGYILPTALHTLLYNWLYCTYCGTAIRLKK